MREIKDSLRRELIEKRKNIPLSDRDEKNARIFEKIKPYLKSPVLCYVSTKYEVGTSLIIKRCLDRATTVAVPRVDGRDMRFYVIGSDNELTDYDGGICIVPALAFNAENFRIGYGGGYYDRFLRDYKGLSVGLCFKEFVMNIPVEDRDVPTDVVITD